jgi:hypothetical protein
MEITGEKYNTLRYTTIKFGDGLIPIEGDSLTLKRNKIKVMDCSTDWV